MCISEFLVDYYYSLLLQWERLWQYSELCSLPELANRALEDMISIPFRAAMKLAYHVDQ